MSYSNFTLESVLTAFQLEKAESVGIFSEMEPIAPSAYLTTGLAKKVPFRGTEWQFLRLSEKRLEIDMEIYPIQQCDKILGILSSMVNQEA